MDTRTFFPSEGPKWTCERREFYSTCVCLDPWEGALRVLCVCERGRRRKGHLQICSGGSGGGVLTRALLPPSSPQVSYDGELRKHPQLEADLSAVRELYGPHAVSLR